MLTQTLSGETKGELNAGIDYSLMNGKLSGTLDVFNRKTSDLILFAPVAVPPNLAPNTWLNSGGFTTNGVEFAINYALINTESFSYTPSLILTSYQTVLDKYLDNTPRLFRTNLGAPGQNLDVPNQGLHILEVGKPIGQITAPIWDGKTLDNGKPVFSDQNGDGKVDISDWEVVGNGLPTFEASLNNAFKFGKIDLNLFFDAAFGHSMVHENRAFYEIKPAVLAANIIKTKYFDEKVTTASYNQTHVEKADFVRLNNASIGYMLSTGSKKYFKSARVYASGQNLLTFTGYTGVDPTVRTGDKGSVDSGGREAEFADPLAPGIDRRSTYYTTRTFTVGVNLGF
jgi:TonB-dependent starch-binding outer membrane protein SusC